VADNLAGLIPRQPLRLLEELAALSRRVGAGEGFARPRVTLHLRSGRDVTGTLLGCAEDHGERVALLLETRERESLDVTHISVSSLEALTVYDAARLDQPTRAVETPGSLELRRAVSAFGQGLRDAGAALKTELMADLPESDFEPVWSALPALEEVLRAILSDDLGREALKPVVSLELSARSEARVTKSGNAIEICAARGFLERPSARDWRELLERVL
jgi:hypothetical protein